MQIYVRADKEMYTNIMIYQGGNVNLIISGTKSPNKTQTEKSHRKRTLVSFTGKILVLSEHPSTFSTKQSNIRRGCSC